MESSAMLLTSSADRIESLGLGLRLKCKSMIVSFTAWIVKQFKCSALFYKACKGITGVELPKNCIPGRPWQVDILRQVPGYGIRYGKTRIAHLRQPVDVCVAGIQILPKRQWQARIIFSASEKILPAVRCKLSARTSSFQEGLGLVCGMLNITASATTV